VSLLGTTLDHSGANWIGVRIDSSGGDLEGSVRLATALAELDANTVRTVAYVPAEASGGAAIVALACDQLVMHPTARLAARSAGAGPGELQAAEVTLREALAPRTDRSWSLLAAMIDPGVELFEYRNKTTGATRIMSDEEAAEQPDPAVWQQLRPIQVGNEPMVFTGQRALELGVAWQDVESYDQLKALYGLTEDPVVAQPNWALEFIEALASPEFAVMLLMAGFAGFYIELRTPGLGVGGFVATVALVLFFWSKYLHGTAGWLEVLLFATGVAFLLLEIFVLPGFGVFGLGGGAMVIASLVLASLTFIAPHSANDVEELARSMGTVALAGVGVLVIAVFSSRFLPQVPVLRKMVLAPPPAEERAYMAKHEAVADYTSLIGTHGVATTDLRPSGKAEIEHRLVDVIAEGEPLEHGTPLVVVDARGNRVLVRAAESGERKAES
jgi:membrane-bound ClpP family serine protease